MSQAAQRARGYIYDVVAHNHAEWLRMVREAARKGMGIEQTDQPYPGHSQTEVHNHFYSPAETPPAAPAQEPLPEPVPKDRYEIVVAEEQPDGTWKEVSVKPWKIGDPV